MILAHLSDLHLGKSDEHRTAALALCEALSKNGVDHTVITGDITEHGLNSEFRLFQSIFSAQLEAGKITVIPGNHDRLIDGVAKMMMGERVGLTALPGFRLIAVDSTGPHNRWRYASHGKMDIDLIEKTMHLVGQAPATDFVAIAMHHHLLPLPVDLWLEKISDIFFLPFAAELKLGRALLERLKGKCDLVLHGHRHAATEINFAPDGRSLSLFNAGSSVKLKKMRLFEIEDGKLMRPPIWIEAESK
jgi:3',5'-cyclic AMP phosphodiesterase CpdA